MVIGIDMDDTICSTNELIIEVADKYDKEVLGGSGVKDETAYEFTEMMGWPEGMKGQFFKDRLEYIMAHSPIKPHAKEIINRLHDEGNKIIIISFRKDKYLTDPYKLTEDWLNDNGVFYDKLFVNTESHCEDVSNVGIDVLLFTNAYNHDEKRFNRVDNWLGVYDYIKEKYYGGENSN